MKTVYLMKKLSDGFTLIEVMIVVAIIAILTTIGIPAYQDHIRRSERATAQAKMLEIAGLLEENYLQRGQYVGAFIIAINADTSLSRSPSPAEAKYNLAVSPTSSSQTYTITATPKGAQSGDRCGTMTLNNANQKTAQKGTTSVTDCW